MELVDELATDAPLGTWLWIGLTAYVLVADIHALVTGRETLSGAFGRALEHPVKKWIPILAWGLTTKHLFLRQVMPWADPYGLMAYGVGAVTTARKKRVKECL